MLEVPSTLPPYLLSFYFVKYSYYHLSSFIWLSTLIQYPMSSLILLGTFSQYLFV